MFVNRSGLKSSTEKTVSPQYKENQAAHKRAAVVGLAVAATVSVVSVTWSRLHAEDIDTSAVRPLTLQAEATASDADLLRQGVNQVRQNQFEDARETLSRVNAANLSESDQRRLASSMQDVERALAGRQESRELFQQGQAALEAGNVDEARRAFRQASDHRFADSATRQKAREQIALADSIESQRAAEQRAEFQQARRDFDAGNYEAARARFEKLDAAGYKTGMFQASPRDYLRKIESSTAVATETQAVAPAVTAEATGETPELDARAARRAAEQQARAERDAAEQARRAAEEQARAERRAAEDQARAERQATEAATRTQRQQANQAYAAGLAALRAGEYETARENFKAADEAGFRPGLFEASASRMLAEVDEREAAARARTEQLAETPAVEGVAPTAVAPETVTPATPDVVVTPAAPDDRRAAEAQARAEREAAEAQARAERQAAEEARRAERQAAEATAKAEREAAAQRQVAAREQYRAGLTALNANDFEAARENFKAADEAGFRPGVFEASAARMLEEVDRREQQVTARAEREGARAPRRGAVQETTTEVAVQPSPSGGAQAELEATASMEQLRREAQAYDAQRLVVQAQTAQQEGRAAQALELYTRAAEIDPSNEEAVQGRNQMLTLQGRTPVTSSLLDQQAQMNRIRKDSITYAFNDAIDRARAAIASDNYSNAQLNVESAIVARQQNPNLFSPEELAAFDATVAQTQLELRQAREAFDRSELQRIADETTRREQERLRLEELERRNTVAALIRDSRRYISQNRYREALATIDQIIAIDSTNEYATGVRPLVEDRALLQEQREYREDFNRNFVRQMNAAQEKRIPYGDIYNLPDNWPQISEDRDRFVEFERGMKQADRAVRAALEKRLPEVRIDGQPFDDVVDFMRDLTGANIFVRWNTLEAAAIDRKTPVTVRLRDVKFSKVLQTVLDSVSTDPSTRLTYTVNEGVITIYATQDLIGAGGVDLVTRVYDITDLMYVIPDLDPGDAQFGGGGGGGGGGGTGTRGGGGTSGGSTRSGGTGGSTRSSGGGGGGGLFGGGGTSGGSGRSGGTSGTSGGQDVAVSERMEDVSFLIEETVAVDTWEEYGGLGSIRPSPLAQQLIITQSPEVHAQIDSLLGQLREAQAIQVTVEARFLTVSRNFLEDIGMDFDFVANAGGGTLSPIVVNQNSTAFTANPNTGIPGSLANSFADQQALNLEGRFGTFLDDFQVRFLIRATQANVSQSVVTAPRVTVYNGGSAQVIVETTQPYVASLTPEVASGVVGYEAEIEEATDGVSLFVRANVSHDRKYVWLYLYPRLERLLGIQNFSYQTAPEEVDVGGQGTVVITPTLTIQQPITQIVEVQTLVSVPDGGTLLLGGQTIAGEIEREAGVPVLSKIPLIKRFFTNRSMAKDESVLLILVKPTIIINKEQEEKQFPLLSSRISGQ